MSPELSRLALKLATGAAKTMAMLIAWQTGNAVRRPGSKHFSRGCLIVAPGLTMKDRLRVLQPNDPDNYYTHREIVPRPAWSVSRRHSAAWRIGGWEVRSAFAARQRTRLSGFGQVRTRPECGLGLGSPTLLLRGKAGRCSGSGGMNFPVASRHVPSCKQVRTYGYHV